MMRMAPVVGAWALFFLALLFTSFAQAQLPDLDDISKSIDKAVKTVDDAARVAKGVSGLSLEEEIAIGDAVALAIVSRYGSVWRDAEATRRVNLVGRVLAKYAVRQDLAWRFGLLDSDAINAFSAPGGRVFITRALYQMVAASDEKLAGILAHEIIHIDERHALDIIARSELVGGVSELVADNSASFDAYEEAVGAITSEILDKGFDPGAEYAADGGGRNLAAVTGFAPGGLRAVLTGIGEMEGRPEEVFSTHPSIEERLSRLPDDPLQNPPDPRE